MKYDSVRDLTIEWFRKHRNDHEKRFSFVCNNGEIKNLSLADIALELDKNDSEIKEIIMKYADQLDELIKAGMEIKKIDEQLGRAW